MANYYKTALMALTGMLLHSGAYAQQSNQPSVTPRLENVATTTFTPSRSGGIDEILSDLSKYGDVPLSKWDGIVKLDKPYAVSSDGTDQVKILLTPELNVRRNIPDHLERIAAALEDNDGELHNVSINNGIVHYDNKKTDFPLKDMVSAYTQFLMAVDANEQPKSMYGRVKVTVNEWKGGTLVTEDGESKVPIHVLTLERSGGKTFRIGFSK